MLPRTPLLRTIVHFVRATEAAAAVEFALVGLPLVGTVLFSMAMGLVFLQSASLDFAVQKAARSMMTGAFQAGQMSSSQYKTAVFCPMLPAVFDCNKLVLNVLVERPSTQAASTSGYYDLVNAQQTAVLTTAFTNSGSAQFCTGQPGDYVYIQALYPLPTAAMFLAPAGNVATVNGQTTFLLDSTLAFRNEQFQGVAIC